MNNWHRQAEEYDERYGPKNLTEENVDNLKKLFSTKTYYALMDLIFTLISFYYLLNIQITNALICWGISEIYSLQRKQR